MSYCRTLIVEDDPHILDVVEFLLVEEDHLVDRATDGATGWARFQRQRYGLVILDLGLPGLHGWDLFRYIRDHSPEQAVIMLTAMGEEEHRVKGLGMGADDYIPKPFSNDELVMRVRNLLRRCPPPPEVLRYGGLRYYPDEKRVTLHDHNLEIPTHELRLLEVLLRQPGRIFSRDILLDEMYGVHTECNDRTVDQAVTRLRRKLKGAVQTGSIIQSVYGMGYKLGTEGEGA